MARITTKIKNDVNAFIDGFLKEEIVIQTPKLLGKKKILKNKPAHIEDEDWVQNCRWVVHSIIQISFEKQFQAKPGEFVSLYSKILKKNCGNNYLVYLIGLINNGIIECDGLYSKKNHESFGFKLSEKYAASPTQFITLTNSFLIKRIKKYRKEKIEELKIKASPIAHLVRWLNDDGLVIEKEAALEYLETYKRKLTKELSKRKLKKQYQSKQDMFILKRYNRIKQQIETWGSTKHISIDNAGGRLYSPITALPSLFRNFLTYNGEKLVGFDIKNSQPLHFLTMLKKEFWKSYTPGVTLKRMDDELWRYLQGEEDYSSTIMFQESSETQYRQGLNNYTFKNLVQNGKLYEFICFKFFNKHYTKGGLDRFGTRAKAKKEFMHMMYHNPKVPYSKAKAIFQDFKTLFPVEAKIMELMKTRKYNDFPIILQKIEAHMLLHRISKRVYDVSPQIPLFTIHDSILTTKQHEKTLKSILEEEYKILLGFIPQFEKTEYSEFNAWEEINQYTKRKVDEADIDIISEKAYANNEVPTQKCEHQNFPKEYIESFILPQNHINSVIPHGLQKAAAKHPHLKRLKK